ANGGQSHGAGPQSRSPTVFEPHCGSRPPLTTLASIRCLASLTTVSAMGGRLSWSLFHFNPTHQRNRECPLWVTCGRRLGKNFLTLLQHWSGAVTCPAC